MTHKDDTDDYTKRCDAAAEAMQGASLGSSIDADTVDRRRAYDIAMLKSGADWGRAGRDAEMRAKAGSVGDLVCEVERLERELKDYKEQLRWSLLNEEKSKENYANVMAEWTADRERLTAENANIKASFDEISRQHTRLTAELTGAESKMAEWIAAPRAERDGLADELKRVVASRSEAHKERDELRARLEKAEEARTYWQLEGSQALKQRDGALAQSRGLALAAQQAGCICDMRIGHPNVREHSRACNGLSKALAEYEKAKGPKNG